MIFLILVTTVSLISCKKDDDLGTSPNTTFNLFARAPGTKANTGITRYIVEIYRTSDPINVVKRVEQASGTIVVPLENGVSYTCLFWADGVALNANTTGTYNATDLKNVTLNLGKQMTEAFCGQLDITVAATTYNVTLKRPTAQVNLIALDEIDASKELKVTYDRYDSFNVYTLGVTGNPVSTSITFNSGETAGLVGTLLTFASSNSMLSHFTALYDSTISSTISNVPLRSNYITNIRGQILLGDLTFLFNVIADDIWESTIDGIDINMGTTENPSWIRVADRNADTNGPFNATSGNSSSDYGSHYQWSNAIYDAYYKSHEACFNFAEGNGLWRVPTKPEWVAMVGNNGGLHSNDANRKLKWNGGPAWKLYNERDGKTDEFVYLPMTGFVSDNSGAHSHEIIGHYWASTVLNNDYAWRIAIINNGESDIANSSHGYGFSVRCVRDLPS